MASEVEITELRDDVSSTLDRVQTRLGEVSTQYPNQYAAIAEQVDLPMREVSTWVTQAGSWLAEKKRKRGDGTELLSAGEQAKSTAIRVEEYVVGILKAPRQAMSSVQTAASRVALAEQRVPVLEAAGGDGSTVREVMSQVQEVAKQVTEMVNAGDVFNAVELASTLDEYSNTIDAQLQSLEVWVSTLSEEVAAAREQAASVDTLAMQAVKSTQSGCPADPKTLEAIKTSSAKFNQAMDILDGFKEGYPPRATTLIYQVQEALKDSKRVLGEVLELEATRNYAYTTVVASNEEIVETLSRSSLSTPQMWEMLDAVSGFLANGEVFAAVSKQAELVDLMESTLRPALSAQAYSAPVEQVVEAEAEFEQAASALEGSDTQANIDLTQLRELVKNLAGEIRVMKEES